MNIEDVLDEIKTFLLQKKTSSEGGRHAKRRQAQGYVAILQRYMPEVVSPTSAHLLLDVAIVAEDSVFASEVLNIGDANRIENIDLLFAKFAKWQVKIDPEYSIRLVENISDNKIKEKARLWIEKNNAKNRFGDFLNEAQGLVYSLGNERAFGQLWDQIAAQSLSHGISHEHLSGSVFTSSAHPVLISGFGWSGSGAVFDYLQQFQSLPTFSRPEIGLFDKIPVVKSRLRIYGREMIFWRWAFQHVLGLPIAPKNSRFSLNNLRSLIFSGHAPISVNSSDAKNLSSRSLLSILVNSNAVLEVCKKEFFIFRAYCQKNDYVMNEVVAKRFSYFISILIAQVCGPRADYALFNQALRPHRLEKMRFLPNSPIMFGVTRDIRDQFLELKAAKRVSVAAEMVPRARRVRKFLSIADRRTDIHHVQFEDFVTSEQSRLRVIETLGLEPDTLLLKKQYFFPAESEKNVGLWREFSGDYQIKWLKKTFPDLCVSV